MVFRGLVDKGARVVAYDPQGMTNARALIDHLDFAENAYDVARDADALVLITEWNEFRSLDLAQLKSLMRTLLLVDLRNVYRHEEVTRHGFQYISIGRPTGSFANQTSEAAE